MFKKQPKTSKNIDQPLYSSQALKNHQAVFLKNTQIKRRKSILEPIMILKPLRLIDFFKIINSTMAEFSYENFLEGKIKDEHAYTHMLQEQVASQKQKISKLLKDISIVRKSQNDLKLRSRQMQQRMAELQMQLKKAKQVRNVKAKEASQKRIRQEKQAQINPKLIFKSYLENTFPKYKGIIKKLMKIFLIMEDHQNTEPVQKIRLYRFIFQGLVKRILDWIFPKRTETEKAQSIAQNLMKQWKDKEKLDKKQLDKNNVVILKEAQYINKIEALQSDILIVKTNKSMLESRLKTYERALQIKGGEFVGHLKKTLHESSNLQPQSHQKVNEILQFFSGIVQMNSKKKEVKEENESIINQVPLVLTEKLQPGLKRKAAPVLKKNIYGYYQQPQFAGNYNLATLTKHVNNNKCTQTLSQDLCILTQHPVIMVTLIDANIKPQRTRASTQFYIKMKINDEYNAQSTVKEGLQPTWNEPFLLKDYDFPFINVFLMHKSKGLRDYAIGGGKFSASSEQEKIVNVRKEKQFQGRVRFSLSYPKGNIYQFKITSVRIEIPGQKIVIKEQAIIKFPYNETVNVEFALPEKIVYMERSIIILQNSEESMLAMLSKVQRKGEILLKEIVGKQGNKEIVVDLQDDWKIIIQGEIYLLICQDQQPEKIEEQLLQGGKGKYFAVRAPPPVVTVTYNNIILHASIKFPLVFHLSEEINSFSIIKEKSDRQIQQQIVDPIISKDGYLKFRQIVKAPSKIYKFFIQTIEGETVRLKHESHLFERLLKEIHLQISYRQDQIQEINYARKGNTNKQKMYKQFTVQSKELLLNHYKIFSKHFKKIGFVKFKLGYTIYDNQLTNENQQISINQSRKIEAIKEGMYFIQARLSQAHLSTKSSSSSYRCVINGQSSKLAKGNHPEWNECFIISFQFTDKFETFINYELWQDSTFGKDKIYEGKITINEAVMRLGAIIVNLDANMQDCLHFSTIRIPSELIRLNIDQIAADIQQDADWIGKIDPYIILTSNNRQLLKTAYLDNIGAHPVWKDIEKQIIIARNEVAPQQEEPFLSCKLYDYDMVGRDDFLGQVEISTKLNNQLTKQANTQIMYGNLVKQKLICGTLKLKGQFQIIKQQKINFTDSKNLKLNKKDIVYRVFIHKFSLNNWKQYKGDKGTLIITREDGPTTIKEFQYKQSQINKLYVNLWGINSQTVNVQLKRQYKHFFKVFNESIGSFSIAIQGKEIIVNNCSIMNEKIAIGRCSWYCQPQEKIKYCIVTSPISCKYHVILRSDLQDQLNLSDRSNFEKNTFRYIFFNNDIFYFLKDSKKEETLTCKQMKKDTVGLYLPNNHNDLICCFGSDETNSLDLYAQQRSERHKEQQLRQYKQLSIIHWEPNQYQSSTYYQFNLKFANSDEIITLKQELNQLYNDYLVVRPYNIPIIFDSRYLPSSLQVFNPKTKHIEATISLEETSKVYIPNKGVLYYKLQDYNLKTIMELDFRYIFLRVQNLNKFKDFRNVNLTLTTSLSLKTYTCQLIQNTNSFLLESAKLLIADPPHTNTLFFQAQITGESANSRQRATIMKNKFGFRLQPNRQQYRIANNEEYIAHSSFTCNLIQRNYEPKQIKDNTIYGMSFISITEIQFQVNEDPSKRHIFLELNILNQYQKLYLEKQPGTNLSKIQLESLLYIEKNTVADISIIEQGVLSNSLLGNATLSFSEMLITKESVSTHCQVIKNKQIIGRLNIKYNNIKEVSFVDVNMFTHITREQSTDMIAELQEFGPNKEKYQKLLLTSKGNVDRLESEDSFIITKDPREYQITVNEKNTNKLLGQFKLCHQLEGIGSKVTVIQPMRTSMNTLNGVLVIQYEQKKSNTITFDQNMDKEIYLIQLEIGRLAFKKHHKRLKDDFSIRMRTALRQNMTKPSQLERPSNETSSSFVIYSHQSCQIAVLDKSDVIGSCKINPPYIVNQQKIMTLEKDGKRVGVFILKMIYLTKAQQYKKMRQVVSVEANDLADTEYFAKMTPFIQMNARKSNKAYVTDLGLGKEKIFWKTSLISADEITFIVKDKDMFYDDLIGSATICELQEEQKEEKVIELALIGQQGKELSKNGKSGMLKVTTLPITYRLAQDLKDIDAKDAKIYMLQLGGIKESQLLKKADSLEIFLAKDNNSPRISLLKENYHQDICFYLANKDIEVQFDSYFLQSNSAIIISLSCNNTTICQQAITKNSNKLTQDSKEIFSICNILPLHKEFYCFERLYLWISQKIPQGMEVFMSTNHSYQRLHIVSYEKYLIVAQPFQLYQAKDSLINIFIKEQDKVFFHFTLDIVSSKVTANQQTKHGCIFNKNDNQVGYFYTTISKFKSQGQTYQRTTNIGKSQRKWLNLCICEANLTKDLQIFSKMDPYCKFSLEGEQGQRKTSVQDNIGMHPIWNQSFFLEITYVQSDKKAILFRVMDEEVTADRMIGEGSICIGQISSSEDVLKKVELFYKEKQQSGSLVIKGSMTSKYIIFRNLVQYSSNKQVVLMIHEENRLSEKGVKVELGLAYPIDSSKTLKFKYGNEEKVLTFLEMKEYKLIGITFTENPATLQYDIYE